MDQLHPEPVGTDSLQPADSGCLTSLHDANPVELHDSGKRLVSIGSVGVSDGISGGGGGGVWWRRFGA